MLKRDFTKSNKEYFSKNKITLISTAIFLIVGILIAAIFGFNQNFELKGYYEFSVNVTAQANINECTDVIEEVVNEFGADFDLVSVFDEGDNTELVVRYNKQISNKQFEEMEAKLANKLIVDIEDISETKFVGPVARDIDYVFTATAILLLVAGVSVFAFFRYNGASALAIIIACALGTLSFMCLSAILRLTIGMSYFAMLAILNLLIVYFACDLFENMRKESWLGSKEYSKALDSAMKASHTRQLFITIALMVVGMMLVLFATTPLKYVSINVLFMAVVLIATAWYVVPFVWSSLITICKIKAYKVKATKVEEELDK